MYRCKFNVNALENEVTREMILICVYALMEIPENDKGKIEQIY